MLTLRPLATALLLGSLTLTGCTAKYADQQQFSGYLRDYSKLEKTESASGQPVLRWVDPNFKAQNYRNMVVQSVQFYPAPKPSEQVNTQALEELYRYTNSQVKTALGKKFVSAPQTPSSNDPQASQCCAPISFWSQPP